MAMTKTEIPKKATEFAIWRAGESCGWDCTQQEIADVVGVSDATVRLVLKKRGWKTVNVKNADWASGGGSRLAVDQAMQNTRPNILGRA